MPKTSVPAKVVFLDRATISPRTRLRSFEFAHDYIEYERSSLQEIAARIAGATVVITNKAPVKREAIASARNLKLVAVAATGTDNVDISACAQAGVTVSNIRNYAVSTVPEHTFALILALRRSLLAYRDSVKSGRWARSGQFCYFDHPIRDLAGSTLGIFGGGVLGGRVAELARAFGMDVLFAARKGQAVTDSRHTLFDEVLRRSDIISLHLPLTPDTRNMIGASEFTQMVKRPLLVNTARGGLVDEAALGQALRSGQLAGAGFDVATQEPMGPDHALAGLLDLPNFLLTPHVAWASEEAIQGLADQLIANIEAFWRGAPVNVVNPVVAAGHAANSNPGDSNAVN